MREGKEVLGTLREVSGLIKVTVSVVSGMEATGVGESGGFWVAFKSFG